MSESQENSLSRSTEVTDSAGFGHGSVKRKLILVSRSGDQKTFDKCPPNEKDFYLVVQNHFSFDDQKPLFLDGNKNLWDFARIVDFFDPVEKKTDMNVSKETKVLAVVRPLQLDADFKGTNFPLIEEERIPHEKMENRPVYQPDIALEEFVDNSLQYTSTCTKKEVYIKHSSLDAKKGSRFISVLDSGIGIEHGNITAWARPGVAYEENKFFHVSPAEGFQNPQIYVGPLPGCKGILHPSNEGLYWTLSWYGLGAKLGGANLSEPGGGVLQLKTQPSHGKGTFAQIIPGFFKCFKHRTLREDEAPEDAAAMDTFTEHRIQGANLKKLMENHEKDFDEVLNNELANVYYMYLIGPSVYTARLRELCTFSPGSAAPRPAWDPLPAPEALSIFIQDKRVDPKNRLYEVNTTLLFFSSRDEIDANERGSGGLLIPRADKCISDMNNRSSFIIWNGKMMPRAKDELFSWKEWGISRSKELSDDIFKKIVILQHYSRAFMPKENKESILEQMAITELKQHFTKDKNLKAKIIDFLIACQKNDAQSYVEYDDKTREITGVRVVDHTRIGFRADETAMRWQDLRFRPQIDQPTVTLDYAKICFGTFSDYEGVLLKIYGPSLTGSIWDAHDGIIYDEYPTVPAKMILNLKERTTQTALSHGVSYARQTPADVTVSVSEVRAGDSAARFEISLVNKSGQNIFFASAIQLTANYSAKFAKLQPKMSVKSSEDNRWIDAQFDTRSFVWVASVVPRKAGAIELQFKLACGVSTEKTPAIESWISTIKKSLTVSSGEPAKLELESPSTVQVGVPFEVQPKLFDDCSNLIEFEDDAKWSFTLTNQSGLRVEQKNSTQRGRLLVEITGNISNKIKSRLQLSFPGISAPATRDVTVRPGAPKVLRITAPEEGENHADISVSFAVSDNWSNAVPAPTNAWVHGDVVEVPQPWKPSLRIESQLYSWTRESEPTFAALPYTPNTLDNRAAKAVVPTPFQASSHSTVDYLSCIDFAIPPPPKRRGQTPSDNRAQAAPKNRVRCFVGDVFRDTRNNFFRILSIYTDGTVKKCHLGYIYTKGAIQVPDKVKKAIGEDANKAIITDATIHAVIDADFKLSSRVWLVSKNAWDQMGVTCDNVYWCDSLYREADKDLLPLWSANNATKTSVALSVVVGNKFFSSKDSGIVIPSNYGGAILAHQSVQDFLSSKKIILNDPRTTQVAVYCATWNGQAVTSESTSSDLGLNTSIPLVIAPLRSCLDQFNQTIRLVAPYDNVCLWNESRLLLKPDPAPTSLRLSFRRADRSSLNDISWDDNNCVLQAVGLESVICSVEALDEVLRPCSHLNLSQLECFIVTPGRKGKTIVGQRGQIQFTVPDSDEEDYEVHLGTETGSISQNFDVKIVSGVPTSAHLMNTPAVPSGDRVTLQLQLFDSSRHKSTLPKSHRIELHLPEALQQHNPALMPVSVARHEPEGLLELETDEPIHAPAKQYINLKLIIYDTTNSDAERRISEDAFKLVVTTGAATGFSVAVVPANAEPIRVESGQKFPKFKITAMDSGGNRVECDSSKLRVTPSVGIVSDVQISQKKGYLDATLTALRSGSGVLSFIYDKFEAKYFNFTISPGDAIVSAVAYFDGEEQGQQAFHIVRSAPVSGRDLRIKVNLHRENGVIESAKSEDLFIEVEQFRRVTRPQRLSEFDYPFSQVGDYGLKLRLSENGGNIDISPLVLQIVPGNPARIHWNGSPPARCTAGVLFPLNFSVFDSVNNAVTPIQTQYLTLNHDNSIAIEIVSPLPNLAITIRPAIAVAAPQVREVQTWVSFTFLGSAIEGGDVKLTMAIPPSVAPQRTEERASNAKRPRANDELKNKLLADIANSRQALERFEAIGTAIGKWPTEPNYPQDNLSSNLPKIAGCFVAGNICYVEVPKQMLLALANASLLLPNLGRILADLPARIAQKLFFLNYIVIDPTVTNKSFVELQDEVRRSPNAAGRAAACFHLYGNQDVPQLEESHAVELKQMIRPKQDISEALQRKVAAFIATKCPPVMVEALAENCKNKRRPYLCLENGVTYNSNETSWDDRQFALSRKFTTKVSEATIQDVQRQISTLSAKIQELRKRYKTEFGEEPPASLETDPKRRKT